MNCLKLGNETELDKIYSESIELEADETIS